MSTASREELRRVAQALGALKGGTVHDAAVRADLRQVRVELADGRLAVIGIASDADGRPRLEIDVVRGAEPASGQLEVRFDP
ncbi:MAG: hypothetical protein NW201_06240 [Gemmatimonadales bacterium]|nr:hypothetical protein [Gemmatimonadales bacterium]